MLILNNVPTSTLVVDNMNQYLLKAIMNAIAKEKPVTPTQLKYTLNRPGKRAPDELVMTVANIRPSVWEFRIGPYSHNTPHPPAYTHIFDEISQELVIRYDGACNLTYMDRIRAFTHFMLQFYSWKSLDKEVQRGYLG